MNMKNFTQKKKILFVLCTIAISISTAFSQTWGNHSLVSQNWPNNDVKSHEGNLYVASNDGIFKSIDNGNTWTDLTSGFSGYSDLVEMQFTNTGNIFARKNSFGVIRSLNAGSTWDYDTTGVGSNYGTDVLYYDEVSDKVFLGIGFPKYRLYYQSPSDAIWTEVINLPAGLNNFSPTQMTRKGNKLFVIDIYKRVLESSDNGVSWIQKAGTGLTDATSQEGPNRFLSIGDDLFFGVAGVWKSTDDGDSWSKIDQGFASSDTRCLYYDGSILYSSVYSQRKTYKSTDNGSTWTDFGGSGSWFFKAMAMHNGSLYGVIHSKDSLYVFGEESTSLIGNNTTQSFKVYPNPANEHVTVSNVPLGSSIKIFSISGKMIYSSLIRNEPTIINTNNLENGVYIFQIENDGNIENKKVVFK
jgi:photosystem II stability/assembly factor-like uncharacterized protein